MCRLLRADIEVPVTEILDRIFTKHRRTDKSVPETEILDRIFMGAASIKGGKQKRKNHGSCKKIMPRFFLAPFNQTLIAENLSPKHQNTSTPLDLPQFLADLLTAHIFQICLFLLFFFKQ
jgi:hypothetical protein